MLIRAKALKRIGVPLGDRLNQLVQIRLVLGDLYANLALPNSA